MMFKEVMSSFKAVTGCWLLVANDEIEVWTLLQPHKEEKNFHLHSRQSLSSLNHSDRVNVFIIHS
jgi:hypothetical protein